MCGVFGIFATRGETLQSDPRTALRALTMLNHRGPDARRVCLFYPHQAPQVVDAPSPHSHIVHDTLYGMLGHTRLSIIDRSTAGLQPMHLKPDPAHTGKTRRYWISYNGEIYNYAELRAELLAQGVAFDSHTDTEVLLALYAQCGAAMLDRLNGMFALAIFDAHEQTLFFARDRYGIKPLYTTTLPSREVAFASELKSLLALQYQRALNPLTLFEQLTFQNHFGDKTLAQGIELLPPGHWRQIDLRSGATLTQSYWEPVFNPQPFDAKKAPAMAETLRGHLEAAIQRQLIGEVPIGSFLSGGMDTGAITALASRSINGLNTYTCGFDTRSIDGQDPHESYFDERTEARELAELLGTMHHDMLIGPDALPQVFERVVWHLDDPRVGISYQNFLVSRMVQDFSTVVLSGVGGDELFAGYPWRYAPVMDLHDATAFSAAYYQRWVRFLSDEQKRELLTPEMNRAIGDYSTRQAFDAELARVQAEHPLHKALCFDLKTFLHGLLIVEDRLSMAHSVESRVPFLDNDLVDFCLTLPPEVQLHADPHGEGPTSKWILKQALHGLLPERVIHRRKQGFTPPDASWYRGPLRGFVEELLLSERALARGIFRPEALRALVEAHMAGRANHRFLLWSLMCLEQWQRLFIDLDAPGHYSG